MQNSMNIWRADSYSLLISAPFLESRSTMRFWSINESHFPQIPELSGMPLMIPITRNRRVSLPGLGKRALLLIKKM